MLCSEVSLALHGIEVAKNVCLVQTGDGDGHAVPDDQLDPETLVHLPGVGVRGADEEA